MSSVVARRLASTPARTVSETWALVISILAPDSENPARAELLAAAGVACAAISSEATQGDPIVVRGAGPQVRIYCIFGDDAISGDGVNEAPLVQSPMEGEWFMSIPCLPEDVGWSQASLSVVSKRITARATGEDPTEEGSNATNDPALRINVEEFLKS